MTHYFVSYSTTALLLIVTADGVISDEWSCALSLQEADRSVAFRLRSHTSATPRRAAGGRLLRRLQAHDGQAAQASALARHAGRQDRLDPAASREGRTGPQAASDREPADACRAGDSKTWRTSCAASRVPNPWKAHLRSTGASPRSGRSQTVIWRAASASATYAASYVVRLSRSSHTRRSSGRCGFPAAAAQRRQTRRTSSGTFLICMLASCSI